jgi:hypothetical protein
MSTIINENNYRLTPDKAFAIKTDDKPYLCIKEGVIIDETSPLRTLINIGMIILQKDQITLVKETRHNQNKHDKYNVYKFFRPLIDNSKSCKRKTTDNINENDCLRFGECLTYMNKNTKSTIPDFNKLIRNEDGTCVLKEKLMGKIFGETDTKNEKILKDIDDNNKNNNAIPMVGESYAIVRKKYKDNHAPYHIAFVLYEHQDINITLEAFAESGREYYPRFSLYDKNPKGDTFHKAFQTDFPNSETIVLESRDIHDVLEEMEKEENKSKSKKTLTSKKSRRIGGKKSRKSYKKKCLF